jgi:hypothetical protein
VGSFSKVKLLNQIELMSNGDFGEEAGAHSQGLPPSKLPCFMQ